MWGKTPEPDNARFAGPPAERMPAPAVPVAPVPRINVGLGKTMRFQGEMQSDEELYLDGEVEGSIEVRAKLTIGPNGKVKADVKAQELVVRGSIRGSVEAAGRIVIMTGASIIGDVKTAGIVIEDGAFFKGGIDILRSDASESPTPAPLAKSHTAA